MVISTSRRYAVIACGAVAAFLRGDVVTLLIETVPLYLLFELGVLFASVAERRARRRARTGTTGEPSYGINTSGE